MEIKNPHCIVKKDRERSTPRRAEWMPGNETTCSVFSQKSVWPKSVLTKWPLMGEGKKKNPKLQKKRKETNTNTKQNKNHTEIEKLPKCITNKILFEEKRAWMQSIYNKWLTWN